MKYKGYKSGIRKEERKELHEVHKELTRLVVTKVKLNHSYDLSSVMVVAGISIQINENEFYAAIIRYFKTH